MMRGRGAERAGGLDEVLLAQREAWPRMIRAMQGQVDEHDHKDHDRRPGRSAPPRQPPVAEHADARAMRTEDREASSTSMMRDDDGVDPAAEEAASKPSDLPIGIEARCRYATSATARSVEDPAGRRRGRAGRRPTDARCWDHGGPNASSASVDCSFGGSPERVDHQRRKDATRTRRAMRSRAAIATLSSRRRRQKSCHGERAATGASPGDDLVDARCPRRAADRWRLFRYSNQ